MFRASEISLDFYGLVSLFVRTPKNAIDFLRTEWGEFENATDRENPDIAVYWKGDGRDDTGSSSSGKKRWAVGWYKGCFWRATLRDEALTRRIEYSSMPRSNFLFKDSCIEPIVLSALESKGLGSLHASSLSIDGQAWIFCGGPRSGKTILALLGVRFGHILLSDDVVVLGNEHVHPYPVPPRVYLHNYRDRELFEELISREVSPDFVRNVMLSFATLGRVRIPTRLRSTSNFSTRLAVTDKIPLGGLFLLRTDRPEPAVRSSSDRISVAREISRNFPAHGGSVLDRLGIREAYRDDHTSALEAQLGALLKDRPVFEVSTTRKMSMGDWTSVFGTVAELAGER